MAHPILESTFVYRIGHRSAFFMKAIPSFQKDNKVWPCVEQQKKTNLCVTKI